jgi:hypothetical protein
MDSRDRGDQSEIKYGLQRLFLCIIMAKERATRRQKDISRVLREKVQKDRIKKNKKKQ